MDNEHSKIYYDVLKYQPIEDLILSEIAEIWYYETGNNIPDRNTPEWDKMYIEWLAFAFT